MLPGAAETFAGSFNERSAAAEAVLGGRLLMQEVAATTGTGSAFLTSKVFNVLPKVLGIVTK